MDYPKHKEFFNSEKYSDIIAYRFQLYNINLDNNILIKIIIKFTNVNNS